MHIYQVTLTFTEPLLGTVTLNKDVYGEFIANNHPSGRDAAQDEIETIEEAMEKGMTGFHRRDGQPFIFDYQIKGFFKDACGMLRRDKESGSAKVTAYKKVIDGLVFVDPREIVLNLPDGTLGEPLQRPLRAQTAQGERVALACSETAPVGTTISFRVLLMGDMTEKHLTEWFTYGALRGLGQWRNASYGRFTYTMEKVS